MSSAKINILFTGATGYIGGSVLARLIDHPDFPTFNIIAIVRSPERAEKLQKLGVGVVVGSHSDEALVEKLARNSDVVIATANADDFEAVTATLRGLKKRFEETKVAPIFIHTSGTGVLTDDAKGLHPTDTIYDDSNPDQIEALAPTQIHRNVDLELVNADKAGYVKTYIVLPSTIYGIARNKLVNLGIANSHSIQIPSLIKASLSRGEAGMVGKGLNIWPNVNIEEVADLYIYLFNAIRAKPDAVGHGREGFYFGESGEHTLYQISKRIAEVFVALGISKSDEPTTFTKEEIDKYFEGSNYLGSNSRCRGIRSRSLGWKPSKTTQDMLDSIRPEVDAFSKE
ncbi:NAD(P)-binding protein [Coprinopsis marcescibilis]|uniref:NAD(P)-binding protein n=1 Tax=Coprinopsis marcescibilis TaxID=230819 RepID=A0A5C3L953_COPMA|nr:NAD(P)-binding protein [Coprinopsis marcescibilis]